MTAFALVAEVLLATRAVQAQVRASVAFTNGLIGRSLFARPWFMGVLITLLSLGSATRVAAQVSTFDANYQSLNIAGLTRVAGSDLAVNAVYRAPGAITIGGTSIDVLVRISAASGASVSNIDVVSSAAFTPEVTIASNNGYVDFELSFATNYVNATTYTPVNLRNFYLTANDIDGNEFVAFSGFDRYYLGSPTQLTVSTVGALTRFQGPSGSVTGTAFSEGYSVIAQYSSPVGALTVRAGQSSASGARQFALEVGTAGGTFSNQLQAGSIGSNQTIAPGAVPTPLTSSTAASGGTAPRVYQWEQSTDGGATFTDIGGATSAGYSPPALSGTTLFRRRVTDAGGGEALSNVVTVRVPDRLAITTAPSATAASGVAFATQPRIQLRDASGTVALAGVVVTAAIASGGGTLGGTLTATTDANGLATFSGLSITGTIGDRTLSFTGTDLTQVTSGTITITAGAAARLAFAVQPATASAGAAISPAVTVRIEDASGNLTTSTASVTLAIAANPASGTLSGTATRAAVGGVATFSGLAIDNAGTGYTLGATSGALTTATSSAFDITTNQLTISSPALTRTKVYDGNTSAVVTAGVLSGVQVGDNVTVTATATYGTAAVGTGKTITVVYTLGGADAASYLAPVDFVVTDGVITQKQLTITGLTASNKVYDGTTTAALTGTAAYNGLVSGEAFSPVTGTPAASFGDANVGTGKAVTVSGYTAPNANYSLTQPAGLTANITPKQLTISGAFTANNKPFDGTTAATIASNTLTLTGLEAGDVGNVSLTGLAAAFANAAVGNGKAVSLTAASLTGSANANYTVTVTGAPTTTANITSVALTIGGSFIADNKVYDATVAATGNTAGLTLAGSPAGVTIASVTLAFQSASVGTGKRVVITGITLGGPNAAGYTLSLAGAPTATAAITPRPVIIGGSFTAADKPFDNNTSATFTSRALTVAGAVNNDVLTLADIVIAFTEPTIGLRTVTIRSATLQGPQSANYTISYANAPTATANILSVVPPGPPRNLLVVPGDGQLTVSWDLPLSEGCRPISGWVLEYSANNGATWTRITYETRLASPVVIRPVINNVPYIVRVAATNACGTSEFAQHAPVTPIAAIRDGNGNLQNNTPGTSTVNTSGTPTTVSTRVVQDTSLVMTGPDFTLSLRGVDSTGTPLPIENMAVQLERSGRASTSGSGFAPGSIVSVFIFGPNGQPILLGTVVVRPDGTFDTSLPIPSSLPPGNYTLQVNGVDAQYRPRTVQLGVQIVEPPAELQFTAIPSENQPAVGDTISITLTVTNVGRGPAIDVVIPRAFAEPGFRVVTATPQQGSYNASTGTWSIPRIEAGANAKLVFTVIVLPPTSSTGVTP
jgi:hypothetical protein